MPKTLCHAEIASLTLAKPLRHAERTTVLHCAASLLSKAGRALCTQCCAQHCAQQGPYANQQSKSQ